MKKIDPSAVFWMSFVHLGALIALPFFTWPALAVCLVLLFTISPIGINMTYHRLLTHRAFKVPRIFEYALATFGTLSGQGSPIAWVAEHRRHHQHSDTDRDPHNSRRGFFYVHMGHLLYRRGPEHTEAQMFRFAPDLAQQSYYRFLHRHHLPIAFSLLPILYLLGGWSWLLWGGFMRATLMLHITWCVNSVTHTYGYRNFETNDLSRNNWWVALLAAGEGWHNNHHADPACAAHGRKWWEFDATYLMIRVLGWTGLATQIKRPDRVRAMVAASKSSGQNPKAIEPADLMLMPELPLRAEPQATPGPV